jgi:hypothetical protein
VCTFDGASDDDFHDGFAQLPLDDDIKGAEGNLQAIYIPAEVDFKTISCFTFDIDRLITLTVETL